MERKNAFEKYIDEIGHASALSVEEEESLARRIADGDARALDRLSRANLKFVVAMANSFRGKGVDISDLVSEGNMALLKAAMDKVGLPYRTGLVATGDWFAVPCQRTQWIADTFHPLLCEMEGCAVAQVCMRNGVKCMAIKSVSDCLVVKHDYYFNFPTAMKDLNRVVMSFIDHLEV